jgi:molybdenum cofactor guanylyltransferase
MTLLDCQGEVCLDRFFRCYWRESLTQSRISGGKMGDLSKLPVRGYVLAGGGSTRFGRDKALARFDGVPLLVRIAEMARGVVEVRVIASPEKYAEVGRGLKFVEDQWPGEGPLGGIVTALQYTAETAPDCEWNLILSCDMPFLTREWLEFLVERSRASEADVVLPHSGHGPEPLCACYRTAAGPALKNVFETGVRKVTQALKHLRCEVLDERDWKRFDSDGTLFWNMNTAADFDEAQRIWNERKAKPAR